MVTEIIAKKEIELDGEQVIVKLLKINKECFGKNVVYFRITGAFKGYRTTIQNPTLDRLRKKYP